MRCFTDDAITELAMKQHAGEAIAERSQDHLEACAECRDAVKRDTATAREMSRALRTAPGNGPGPCLSDNDLSEYIEHSTDPDDLARVERHLAACGDCITALVELDNLIQVSDSATSPVRYAIRLARSGAEFLTKPDKGFRKSILAYVPTLKEPDDARDLCAWSQNVDGHPLHFKLQGADDEHVHLTLSVESRGFDRAKTTVTLRKDGDLVQSEQLGSDGLVRLPNLHPGAYAFDIQSGPDLDIRIDLNLQ
jgi:hypothetical protein